MPVALVGVVSVVFLALAGVLTRQSITSIMQAIWSAIPSVSIPKVGDLFGPLRHALQSAAGTLESWGDAVAQPFADALAAPVDAALFMFNITVKAFQGLLHAIEHTVTVTIPAVRDDLFNRLVGVARDLQANINALAAHAAAALLVAQSFLFDRIVSVARDLQGNINALAVDAARALDVAQAFLFGRIVSVAHDLQGNINALAAEAAHAIASTAGQTLQAAEQVAARDAAEAVHALDVVASVTAGAAIGGLLTDVDALGRDMAGGFADVREAIGDIPVAIPATIAGALATSALATRALARLARECTVPNCRTVNGAKGFLDSLLSGVELDAFIALVASLAADPAHAAQRMADDFGPVAREAESIGRGLLGLVTN